MEEVFEQPLAVLLADHDEDSRSVCRETMARAGIEVATASSSRAAIAAARSLMPRVIIWAVGLPGFAETTAVRHFRGDPAFRRTTLIALSSRLGATDESQLRDAGFDRVLSRPVAPDVILACVRDALRAKLSS
ncbi:MAG TPA: response regulator [Gemmatimonadaceae bacterium]|jgi:CheY-like chemotaxis protein|nr:response regulator [Gemmatimonadaceae bacterium]